MKKSMTIFLVAVCLLSFGLMSSSAWAKSWDKVRIGTEGAYPPFNYVDENGKLQGFDIDISKALCEEMGVECEFIEQDWDGLIPGLLAKKFDCIIASMSITEERKEKVDFTKKYYQTPARFVTEEGSDIEISDQGLEGKIVGVQRATVSDNFLTDNFGDVVQIKRYATQDEANMDLVSGRVDLIIADSVVLSEGFLSTEAGEGYAFIGPGFTDEEWFGEGIGIALRKGDDKLRQMFNKAIKEIRANGTYKRINDQYFDFDAYGE